MLIGAFLVLAGAPLLEATAGQSLDGRFLILTGGAVLPIAVNRIFITMVRGSGGILAAQWLDGPQAMLLAVMGLAGLLVAGARVDALSVTTLYFAASATTGLAAAGLYADRTRSWPAAAPAPLAPLLRQGGQIAFIVLSRMMIDWIALLTLSASHSVADVGVFRTAWLVASLVSLVVTTFDTVAGPRIAAAHRVGDRAGIRRIMRQSVVTMAALSAPLLLVMLAAPAWLLGLFGAEFTAGATALRLLALGQIVNIVAGPVGAMLLMTGNERWSALTSLGCFILLGLAAVTIIPAYGIEGAAAATSLLILFRTGVQWLIVRRQLAEPPEPTRRSRLQDDDLLG